MQTREKKPGDKAVKTKIIQRQKHNVLGEVIDLPHFELLIHIHLSLTQETPLVPSFGSFALSYAYGRCHAATWCMRIKMTPFIKNHSKVPHCDGFAAS